MSNTGSRKQITFDLHQESLKQLYPHTEPPQNAQYYKFEHRQYSVYVSAEKLTTLDVIGLMEQLAEQFPWLSQCVNEIDVTNIGVQHSLKHVLENASKPLDVDLSEISLEPLPKIERPNPPTESRTTRKKSRSPER